MDACRIAHTYSKVQGVGEGNLLRCPLILVMRDLGLRIDLEQLKNEATP